MRKFLFTVAAFAVATLALAVPAHATQDQPDHKVWICHGLPFAADHDYNLIQVDQDAVDGEGENDHTSHVGREDRFDDIIPAPQGEDGPYCPETPPVTTTTEPPTTTTTEPPVTTTVPPVTTTAPPVVTSEAPAPQVPVATPELAFTGQDTAAILGEAIAGSLAVALGLYLVFEGKRRKGESHWTYRP